MNENEIRDVLTEGIGEEPPITGGPAAVFAGARSHVARTRTLTGALSVAAVLGVAAGAVALSGSGSAGTANASQGVVPGAVATDAAPKAKEPSPTPGTTRSTPAPATSTPKAAATSGVYHGHVTHNPAPDPGPGQVLIDGRSVGELVKSMLPAGLVTANHEGQDSYDPARDGVETGGSMSLDDGSGRLTTVYSGITENNRFAFADMNCPTLEGFNSMAADCRTFPQADGSVIMTYRTDDLSPTNGPTKGSYSLVAERAFPNGMEIDVVTSNYFDPLNDPHEKGWHVSPTRSTVLLTMDQLKAMLMDSRWGLTVPAQFAQQARADLLPYVDRTQRH